MTITWKKASPLLVTAFLSAGFALAGVAAAAGTSAPPPGSTAQPATNASKPTAPAMETKVAAPSKAEAPDTAFHKLDMGSKGYVTKDDAKSLSGFEKAFQDNDNNHDGKLSSDEFRKAWAEFSGNKY